MIMFVECSSCGHVVATPVAAVQYPLFPDQPIEFVPADTLHAVCRFLLAQDASR